MRCVTLLGVRIMTRDFGRQGAEVQIRIVHLNRFTAPGYARNHPHARTTLG